MQKEDFKPGDLVQLLSGGPTMTITATGAIRDWCCGWFTEGEYKLADFYSVTLKKVEAPASQQSRQVFV